MPTMNHPKVLLVDDNEAIRNVTQQLLEINGFDVIPAASVTEALTQIVAQPFNVLITDLHMPDPGDGFSVVTAMRHAQPDALTFVVSGFPDVQKAMAAILLQADDVLLKPFDVELVAGLIRRNLSQHVSSTRLPKESIASILERETNATIQRWLARVEKVEKLAHISLTREQRIEHLPAILKEIISRLRGPRMLETEAGVSPAALAHGQERYRQGYTPPLLVQESRVLQVCIFETIQRNMATVNFSTLLSDIMLIADEVDAQLSQSIEGYLTMQRRFAA